MQTQTQNQTEATKQQTTLDSHLRLLSALSNWISAVCKYFPTTGAPLVFLCAFNYGFGIAVGQTGRTRRMELKISLALKASDRCCVSFYDFGTIFISPDNVTNFQGYGWGMKSRDGDSFPSLRPSKWQDLAVPLTRAVRGALTSDWRCEVDAAVWQEALAKMSVSIWMLNLIRASGQLISSVDLWSWHCTRFSPLHIHSHISSHGWGSWCLLAFSARQFARRLGFKSVHVQVKCQHQKRHILYSKLISTRAKIF